MGMLGYVFCRTCGVPIAPFGPDTCSRCELESQITGVRVRVRTQR
jgi:hypothetical protein